MFPQVTIDMFGMFLRHIVHKLFTCLKDVHNVNNTMKYVSTVAQISEKEVHSSSYNTSRQFRWSTRLGWNYLFLFIFLMHKSDGINTAYTSYTAEHGNSTAGQQCITTNSFTTLRIHRHKAVDHWRRQLRGTGAHAPPRLPASYFGDLNFKRTNTENVQNQRDFCAIFINFWPIFVIFYPVFLRE